MRVGVSYALAVILILAASPMVSVCDLGTQTAEAAPLKNPGEPLVVNHSYSIQRYEEWGEVTVEQNFDAAQGETEVVMTAEVDFQPMCSPEEHNIVGTVYGVSCLY